MPTIDHLVCLIRFESESLKLLTQLVKVAHICQKNLDETKRFIENLDSYLSQQQSCIMYQVKPTWKLVTLHLESCLTT